MMKKIFVFMFFVATIMSCSADLFADEYGTDIQQTLITEIGSAADLVKSEIALCASRAVTCSFLRISRARRELGDLLDNAIAMKADLQKLQSTETDPPTIATLGTRIAALQGAINTARKQLLAGLPTSPAELSAEEKEKVDEKKIVDEIKDLVDKITIDATLCQASAEGCERTRLARERFELRDRLAEAESRRASLRKKEGDEKDPDKADALGKRASNLLRGTNTARDITFDAKGVTVAADELVDTVKTLGKRVDDLGKERKKAKEVLKAASKDTKANDDARQSAAEQVKHSSEALQETSIQLATAEQRLRLQGVKDRDQIATLEKKLSSGALEPSAYGDAKEQKEHLENRLSSIESLITLPSTTSLFNVYEDDGEQRWIQEFYAGMEFDTVSGIFNKGFARIGYSASLHLGGEHIPEAKNGLGLGYGRYYEFNALLSSSAEQSLQSGFDQSGEPVTDPCKAGFKGSDPCIRRAFEVEQKIFWPIYRTERHDRVRPYFGPVVSFGARFVDPGDDTTRRADYRYYFGSHFGFGRDGYGEFLYGRTASLDARRLEVRGEIPVAQYGNNSRLLLGWSANFRAGHNRHHIDVTNTADGLVVKNERDVFRIFLVYNLDFFKLPIGIKPPKPE